MTMAGEALDGIGEAAPAEQLERLFDAHHQRLYRLARRLIDDPDEARDLVQETFLRAARRPASIPRDEAGGEAWLVRVAVNLCRDRHRRRGVRQAGRPLLPRPEAEPDPESAAVARATVAAALAHLAPRQRAVVVLRELEERPTAEVARLLGVSRVTVRWHLAQGRRELARWLLAREEGPGPGGGPKEVER
jgi:RNA polymerase sigma-70 factor, ECF subfamily